MNKALTWLRSLPSSNPLPSSTPQSSLNHLWLLHCNCNQTIFHHTSTCIINLRPAETSQFNAAFPPCCSLVSWLISAGVSSCRARLHFQCQNPKSCVKDTQWSLDSGLVWFLSAACKINAQGMQRSPRSFAQPHSDWCVHDCVMFLGKMENLRFSTDFRNQSGIFVGSSNLACIAPSHATVHALPWQVYPTGVMSKHFDGLKVSHNFFWKKVLGMSDLHDWLPKAVKALQAGNSTYRPLSRSHDLAYMNTCCQQWNIAMDTTSVSRSRMMTADDDCTGATHQLFPFVSVCLLVSIFNDNFPPRLPLCVPSVFSLTCFLLLTSLFHTVKLQSVIGWLWVSLDQAVFDAAESSVSDSGKDSTHCLKAICASMWFTRLDVLSHNPWTSRPVTNHLLSVYSWDVSLLCKYLLAWLHGMFQRRNPGH